MRAILIQGLITFFFQCVASAKSYQPLNRVLVFSFDGFRHDYVSLAEKAGRNVSMFRWIQSRGVTGLRMQNVYPTLTFPNHFSLATGTYTETHGLFDIDFFAADLNQTFNGQKAADHLDPVWFNFNSDKNQSSLTPEPIWITNQRHGYHSGIAHWIGSVAPHKGHVPTYTEGPYNGDIPLRYSIDRVLEWFKADPLMTLGMIYFHEPDVSGHNHGPTSDKTYDMIESLNTELAYLITLLHYLPPSLLSTIHIILLSDHGMHDLSLTKPIYLDHYVDPSLYHTDILGQRCFIHRLFPTSPERVDNLYSLLKNKHPHLNVYRRSEIPDDYHYKNSPRAPPILLVPDENWSIVETNKSVHDCSSGGSHGYPPSVTSMSPYFMAYGSSFQVNYTVPLIYSIDIYSLLCHILDLYHPAPNNGSLVRIQKVLRPNFVPNTGFKHSFTTIITISATAAFTAMIAAYVCLVVSRQPRELRYARMTSRRVTSRSKLGRGGRGATNGRGRQVDETGLLSDPEDDELEL